MTTAAILERLQSAGLHIKAEGGNLRVGPRECVTPETLNLIRKHKAELLAALAIDPARHWRWLFRYPNGEETEYRILPEPNEEELQTRYPGVVHFEHLPDTLQ